MTGNNVTGTHLYESDYIYMGMVFMVVMTSLSAVTSFSSYSMVHYDVFILGNLKPHSCFIEEKTGVKAILFYICT